MNTILASIALVLAPATPQDSGWNPLDIQVPPKPGAGQLRWVGDYFEALQEARLRNCPIVAVISDDQSIGFQTIQQYLYATEEFPRFITDYVLVPAFDGQEHDFEERIIEDQVVEWCSIFDIPCEQHRKIHANLYRNLITREFWNPMHVFLDADGIEIHRVEGHEVRFKRFQEEAEFAQQQLGKPISFKDYRRLLLEVKEALDSRHKRGHASTFRGLEKLAKKEFRTEIWQAWHEELVEKLVAEGDEMVYQARALLREGAQKAAERLLKKVQREFRGHGPGEDAAELLEDG